MTIGFLVNGFYVAMAALGGSVRSVCPCQQGAVWQMRVVKRLAATVLG